MALRKDAHRPGAIIPADYEYVLSYNSATSQDGWPIPSYGINCGKGRHHKSGLCCVAGLMETIQAKFSRTSTGQCAICSTHFIFGDVWKHIPTGDYIHVGHNCSDKYSMLADRSAWEMEHKRAKARAAVDLEKSRRKEAREEFLKKYPGLCEDLEIKHPITESIKKSFYTQKWCSLTPKQIALVKKLADEVRNPKPADPDPTIPAPKGREEVTGIVLAVKHYENDGYSSFDRPSKMLVKLNHNYDGAKIWVTQAKFGETEEGFNRYPQRGEKVTLKATFTRSDTDQFFAFGKCPKILKLENNV